MSKLIWNALKVSPALIGACLLFAHSALAQVTESTTEPISSLEEINEPDAVDPMDQVTNVSQLRDVRPGDWAYEALRELVERYGCIAGYPDGTYRGNRALTRYEFAAGVRACLLQVEKLIAASTADLATKEDLETLRRLVQEFQAELATLGTRVDKLEGRVGFLENHQFSTTTKLNGEVVVAISDVFGDDRAVDPGLADRDLEFNTIISNRVRLNLDTSFTGKDRLRTRLQARNTPNFSGTTGTNMARLGFDGDEGNVIHIHRLEYSTPLSSKAKLNVLAVGGEFNDMINNFNPLFADAALGSISRFGRFSPIYRQSSEGTGVSLDYNFSKAFGISLGYLVPRGTSFREVDLNGRLPGGITPGNAAATPNEGLGLFGGGYAAVAQLSVKPTNAINVGLTYIHSYNTPKSGVNIAGSTGSNFANQPFGNVATSANHYGLEANFRFSPKVALGGWAGYSTAILEDGRALNTANTGDSANIWNWAVNLGFSDFGKKGNLLGFVFGMPPKATDNDLSTRKDPDTSYHIEGLYRFQVTDNIAITPGLLVILNPNHNDNNDTIYVGTVRTTFKF